MNQPITIDQYFINLMFAVMIDEKENSKIKCMYNCYYYFVNLDIRIFPCKQEFHGDCINEIMLLRTI